MRIYTKTGDAGQTGLIGGQRVDKDHVRVAAYGHVDELNAAIGLAAAACPDALAAELGQIQAELFSVGAELAAESGDAAPVRIDAAAVKRLEGWLDRVWEQLPELRTFILPGGCEPAARLHFARTVCRRAERAVVELSKSHPVGDAVIPYLNRLGDLLFAYARWANKLHGVADVPWVSPEKRR